MIGLRYRDKTDNCDLKPESFRFSAYRNLFILTYGRTRAKMERKPLPSCLVMRVRTLYPDPHNQYTGFKAKRLRKRWFFVCFRTECLQQTCSTICPLSLRHSQVDYSGATATAPGAHLRHRMNICEWNSLLTPPRRILWTICIHLCEKYPIDDAHLSLTFWASWYTIYKILFLHWEYSRHCKAFTASTFSDTDLSNIPLQNYTHNPVRVSNLFFSSLSLSCFKWIKKFI